AGVTGSRGHRPPVEGRNAVASSVDARIRRLHLRRLGNYAGQLRPYSYADLVLLFAALHATPYQIVGCSLLWFGFLIHLEWWHRDEGRLLWPPYAWVIPWIAGTLMLPE